MTKTKIDNPHFLNHRQRLRDRFNSHGINGLQDYEIIELFLTFVIPQKDVKQEAKEVIERFGSLKGFFEAEESELQKINYFKDKALTLRRFIREVSELYQFETIKNIPVSQSRESLMSFCKSKLGFVKEEQFWVISLDSKFALLKADLISKGLTDKTTVYPKQIVETALKNKAYSIILLHNHPNGNPQPSEEDRTITKAIEIPAKLINITIYDHIIVSEDKYFSFKENKLL
ncbi:MAG: hypothetical protein A2X05_12720 [Bacteroidetes bacterium GWE2_41_25]|nr:MAG: hypothetical protein A2X05_12720 [Bacteroidetes bacterium GWE2_41_25]